MDEMDFIDLNQDFNQNLYDDSSYKNLEKGSKVSGIVSDITSRYIFISLGAKQEGIIAREEIIEVSIGDLIEAFVVKQSVNEIVLSTNLASHKENVLLQDIFLNKEKIEGKVIKECKGGFQIKIFDEIAFCPISQIDLRTKEDKSYYLDKKYDFYITEYNNSNFVVSRKKLLQEKRAEQIQEYEQKWQIGDILEGEVIKLAKFGAFVSLGEVDGLIPLKEISWNSSSKIDELLKVGDKISVRIISLDWQNNRISLSLKDLEQNPWQNIHDKYILHSLYQGEVVSIHPFGAFIALDETFQGLLPIGQINNHKLSLKEGDSLDVFINSIDIDLQRISFSLEKKTTLVKNSKVKATIIDLKENGLNVKIHDRKAFLVLDRINWQEDYKINQEILVKIDDIIDKTIHISLPENNNSDHKKYLQSNSITSLDEFFKDL